MRKKKKPTYTLKAESGKFGIEGQDIGGPDQLSLFQGDQIIVGVVAMHNMMMAMARALQASNRMLEEIHNAWMMGEDVDIQINWPAVQIVIDENKDILKNITVKDDSK
jgi:hypothetical protein